MNVDNHGLSSFEGEPLGQKTNAIRWLQKKIMAKAGRLPRDFQNRKEWEEFCAVVRKKLPEVIGIPSLPPLKKSRFRGVAIIANDIRCERVDVYVDEDYAIPAFIFLPVKKMRKRMPGLVWNPGWRQSKWDPVCEKFAVRMAKQGFIVAVFDHTPFGETAPYADVGVDDTRMTLAMSMGHVLGISQLALRAVETSRVGEYLRSRPDVDPRCVAVAGLCQGGMDTWLAAALDQNFCAAAPLCAASTFAVHFAEMANYRANGDSSPFPFGILNVCDIEHLHAAIAPRPLLVQANLPDNWWPVSGYSQVEEFTRKIYRLYAAEKKVHFHMEVHEHNITGPFADRLEQFLLKYVLRRSR